MISRKHFWRHRPAARAVTVYRWEEKVMKKKQVYDLLFGLCIVIFLVSGGMLLYKVWQQKKNDGRLEDLSGLVAEQLMIAEAEGALPGAGGQAEGDVGNKSTAGQMAGQDMAAMREARVKAYSKIKEQNSDLVGWVKIEGTKIDYPVLQTPDSPNFYLSHDFDKKSSIYGAPYVAEECDLAGGCKNILIYGHHMKNGSMFAALDEYLDKGFRDEHPIIQFDTLEEYGNYEVMAVFTMSAVDQDNPLYGWIGAGGEEDFANYVSYIKQHSQYDTGIDAQWGDHLISLVTCEYTHRDGRLIVVAKKMEND